MVKEKEAFEIKIPTSEETRIGGEWVRFLLYPMGIFVFRLHSVPAKGGRVDTMPRVNGFPSPRGPHGRPSDRLEESFFAQSDLPLEPVSLQVSLRGCQGFTCWQGAQLLPQTWYMKGRPGELL